MSLTEQIRLFCEVGLFRVCRRQLWHRYSPIWFTLIWRRRVFFWPDERRFRLNLFLPRRQGLRVAFGQLKGVSPSRLGPCYGYSDYRSLSSRGNVAGQVGS